MQVPILLLLSIEPLNGSVFCNEFGFFNPSSASEEIPVSHFFSEVQAQQLLEGNDWLIRVDFSSFSSSGHILGQRSTVDGSEIRRSPVDVVNIPVLAGFHAC